MVKKIKVHQLKQFTPTKSYWINENKITEWKHKKRITSTSPIKNEVGQLRVHFKFYKDKKKTIWSDEWGHSFLYDLSNIQHYRRAKLDCFKSALSKKTVFFSPVDFDIIDERFTYYFVLEKQTPLEILGEN